MFRAIRKALERRSCPHAGPTRRCNRDVDGKDHDPDLHICGDDGQWYCRIAVDCGHFVRREWVGQPGGF
jgi:hypothetical protein